MKRKQETEQSFVFVMVASIHCCMTCDCSDIFLSVNKYRGQYEGVICEHWCCSRSGSDCCTFRAALRCSAITVSFSSSPRRHSCVAWETRATTSGPTSVTPSACPKTGVTELLAVVSQEESKTHYSSACPGKKWLKTINGQINTTNVAWHSFHQHNS